MASGALGSPGFALLGAYSPLERADWPLTGAAGFRLFGARVPPLRLRHHGRTQALHLRLLREPHGGRCRRLRRAPNEKSPRYAKNQGLFQCGSGDRV